MRRAALPPASVLIVVLWACLGLVSVALLFGHSVLLSYRGSDNDLAGRQADQALEGMARFAETLLTKADTPGVLPDPATYQNEAVTVGEATAWFIGRAADATNTGSTRSYGLVDEASKINLNTATVDMLRAVPGMTDELAGAIIDWRDADEDISANGAESETYLRKQPPYACKNAPFESIEELALVNGADELALYGEDANLNGVLDPNEDDSDKAPPADNADGKLDAGVLDYVTVYSREPNKRADGTARVNVTRPGEDLRTLLTDKLGDAKANEVMTRFPPNAPAPIGSVLEFYARSGMSPEDFVQIEDAITTTTGDFIQGRVNVNTASEAVLACIPGIGEDNAATLIATRTGRVQTDTSVVWIAETLGPVGATRAGPFVTGASWQVTADVAAVGRKGRGFRRTKFVIDNSSGTPQIVYRRDLSALGWALGSEARQTLGQNKNMR